MNTALAYRASWGFAAGSGADNRNSHHHTEGTDSPLRTTRETRSGSHHRQGAKRTVAFAESAISLFIAIR